MMSIISMLLAGALASQGLPYAEAELTHEGEIIERQVSGEPVGGIYQAGSISKYACTLVAMRLESAGLLGLDDRVGDLLPGYDGAATDVTLRQLLSHRAGVADGIMAALRSDPSVFEQRMTTIEAANQFAQELTGDDSGTVFDYVITNWVLVQAVLEEVSGLPYARLADIMLFTPAGADSAFILEGTFGPENSVKVDGRDMPVPSFVGCAGGLAVTPTDLLGILRYPHVSGDFRQKQLRALRTHTTPDEDYTLCGRFVSVIDEEGRLRMISWQSGSNGDWKSRATYDPVSDTGHVALSAAGDSSVLEDARAEWMDQLRIRLAP